MICYSDVRYYRGYAICLAVEGGKHWYTALQGTGSWWEAHTVEEVKSLIDAAMADA